MVRQVPEKPCVGFGFRCFPNPDNKAGCEDGVRYDIVRYAYNVLWSIAMHKRMTITLDEAVYEGLYRTVGKRRMSQFIEDLLRPHVMDTALDDGYRSMAADQEREAEAMEWCNAIAGDMANDAR